MADTGYAGIWAGTMVDLLYPEQSFIRAAGSLGLAFPASLGAKCASPERPVLCFIGDGGFWYHLSEIETALRWNIKTVTVVKNNSCLQQVSVGIKDAYGNMPGNRGDLYQFRDNIDFARIAEEMGCLGIRVEHPDEIRSALEKALAAEIPAVLDVLTDPKQMAPWAAAPPFKAKT